MLLMNLVDILILNAYKSYIIILRDKIKHNIVKSINLSVYLEFMFKMFKYLLHNHNDKNVF